MKVIASVIVPIFVSLVTATATSAMLTEPDVSLDDATEYLQSYYESVVSTTNEEELHSIWEANLTERLRSFPRYDFKKFKVFYTRDVSNVDVTYMSAVTGVNQFGVTLQFTGRQSGEKLAEEAYAFYLKCNDKLARLPLKTCSRDKLQIELVSKSEGSQPS